MHSGDFFHVFVLCNIHDLYTCDCSPLCFIYLCSCNLLEFTCVLHTCVNACALQFTWVSCIHVTVHLCVSFTCAVVIYLNLLVCCILVSMLVPCNLHELELYTCDCSPMCFIYLCSCNLLVCCILVSMLVLYNLHELELYTCDCSPLCFIYLCSCNLLVCCIHVSAHFFWTFWPSYSGDLCCRPRYLCGIYVEQPWGPSTLC